VQRERRGGLTIAQPGIAKTTQALGPDRVMVTLASPRTADRYYENLARPRNPATAPEPCGPEPSAVGRGVLDREEQMQVIPVAAAPPEHGPDVSGFLMHTEKSTPR